MGKYYIGWDVGGWNCDRNQKSRDAILILDEYGRFPKKEKPFRGNLKMILEKSTTTKEFLKNLFILCELDLSLEKHRYILAIDTPLGFSDEFVQLITSYCYTEPVPNKNYQNPYLFRKTERILHEKGVTPLSAIKDMIGSQSTKGIHLLSKFAPKIISLGVWKDQHDQLKVIETYPSALKKSEQVQKIRQSYKNFNQPDIDDALYCAIGAMFFDKKKSKLIKPEKDIPINEGWIWVPELS